MKPDLASPSSPWPGVGLLMLLLFVVIPLMTEILTMSLHCSFHKVHLPVRMNSDPGRRSELEQLPTPLPLSAVPRTGTHGLHLKWSPNEGRMN